MDIDSITILTGIIFIIITIIVIIKRVKQKKKSFDKTDLFIYLGYILFSIIASILFVKMLNLAYLTYKNEITLELIQQNKIYIFFAWLIMSMGAVISYISLLLEENKNKGS